MNTPEGGWTGSALNSLARIDSPIFGSPYVGFPSIAEGSVVTGRISAAFPPVGSFSSFPFHLSSLPAGSILSDSSGIDARLKRWRPRTDPTFHPSHPGRRFGKRDSGCIPKRPCAPLRFLSDPFWHQGHGIASMFIAGSSRSALDLMGVDLSIAVARRVWGWIKRSHLDCFTVRNAFNALRRTFPRVTKLHDALDALEERGYVQVIELPWGGRGRPPSSLMRVRPEIARGPAMSWRERLGASLSTETSYTHNTQKSSEQAICAYCANSAYRMQKRKTPICWRPWPTSAGDSTSRLLKSRKHWRQRTSRTGARARSAAIPWPHSPTHWCSGGKGIKKAPCPLHRAGHLQALRPDLAVVLRRDSRLPLVLEPGSRQADTAPLLRPLRRLHSLQAYRPSPPWALRERRAGSHRRMVGHRPALLRTLFAKATANPQRPTKAHKGWNKK